MSIPATDIPRRVTQLREDLDATYELFKVLERTQKDHGNRLDRIERRVGRLESQVTELRKQVGGLQGQMGGLQKQMGGLQKQVGEVQTQVSEHGRRLGRIEDQLTHVVELLETRSA